MSRGLHGRSIMDKPLTPAEQLADAVRSLTLSLEQLREALDTLTCEIMVAECRDRERG